MHELINDQLIHASCLLMAFMGQSSLAYSYLHVKRGGICLTSMSSGHCTDSEQLLSAILYTFCDIIINPQNACTAKVTVVVVCVCLSVDVYLCTTGNKEADEGFQRL